MHLFFIRHGQTDFNKQGRPQGQEIDAPLNDEGVRQVEEAAQHLPDNIHFIISSPLKRAHQTANILNKKLNIDIQFNDYIKELKYGSLAGKLWSEIEIETADTDVHEKDRRAVFDYRSFGGESSDDLKQRVTKFIEEVKEKHQDKTILITTHGGVIDAMHLLYPQKE
ncbi:MAG TPA: histidine phosphatase family protein, partial [Candidatus Paceibacterota bacterium]